MRKVRVIAVFDGWFFESKTKTIIKRINTWSNDRAKGELHESIGDFDEANKFYRRSQSVKKEMVEVLIDLLI